MTEVSSAGTGTVSRGELRSFFQRYNVTIEREGVTGDTDNSPLPDIMTQVDAQGRHSSTAPANNTNFNLSPSSSLERRAMLPMPLSHHKSRHLLVLDLDETLVHSSFTPVHQTDIVLPVVVEGQQYKVYVKFRPGLMQFLEQVSQLFECCIFTASLSVYAQEVMNYLDPDGALCPHRLFREHCSFTNGAYVKDLSLLGRDLHRIAIVDNSPVAYLFQPRNAIPVVSWFDDPKDTELMDMIPWLHRLAQFADVYSVLDERHGSTKVGSSRRSSNN